MIFVFCSIPDKFKRNIKTIIGKDTMLNITERQTGETTILDLEGNVILGGGSRKLGEEVRRVLTQDKANVLLNFAGVKYLDSSGVGELVSMREAVGQAGGNLKLAALSTKVEEVLSLSGVLPIFDIYEDEQAALNLAQA